MLVLSGPPIAGPFTSSLYWFLLHWSSFNGSPLLVSLHFPPFSGSSTGHHLPVFPCWSPCPSLIPHHWSSFIGRTLDNVFVTSSKSLRTLDDVCSTSSESRRTFDDVCGTSFECRRTLDDVFVTSSESHCSVLDPHPYNLPAQYIVNLGDPPPRQ